MEVFTASPRDRAQQRFVEQNMLTLLFLMVVLEREVFAVFPEDSIPQRLPVSRPPFLLVEVFMKVFKVEDRSEVLRIRLRIGSMEISTRRLWLKRRGRSKLGFRSGWSRAIQVLGLWLLIRKAKLTSGIAVRGGSAGSSLLALPARDPWRFQWLWLLLRPFVLVWLRFSRPFLLASWPVCTRRTVMQYFLVTIQTQSRAGSTLARLCSQLQLRSPP